jgi:hypothetical protein
MRSTTEARGTPPLRVGNDVEIDVGSSRPGQARPGRDRQGCGACQLHHRPRASSLANKPGETSDLLTVLGVLRW